MIDDKTDYFIYGCISTVFFYGIGCLCIAGYEEIMKCIQRKRETPLLRSSSIDINNDFENLQENQLLVDDDTQSEPYIDI